MADSRNELYNYARNDANYVINMQYILFEYFIVRNLLWPLNSKKIRIKYNTLKNRLFSDLCAGDI